MVSFETQRLVLRDFVASDFEAVHEYGSDTEVSEYEPWGPNTKETTKAYLDHVIGVSQEIPRLAYEMAVVLKDSGELIGSGRVGPDAKRSDCLSIGYVVNPRYQGQGFGTEVARKLIEIGFEQLGADLIFATCDVLNGASKRVLEKVGMHQKDFIKNHFEMKGRLRDSYFFEIEKGDFETE